LILPMTEELMSRPIAELAPLLRERAISPVELFDATLRRIHRLQPKLNSFITITEEEGRKAALRAEDEIQRGQYRGPLHGIPISVKDLFATRGVRTTAGSKILGNWTPDFDATAVAKLHEAGTVMIGKTHMHEFAYGVTSDNPHYGPARNPLDATRVPGGSSGGSGAAVASSQCAASLASDSGGSIRIPSAICGVVGLKPTYGRVSRHGAIPLAWSLDHVGPIAKTVEDAAIFLSAIAASTRKMHLPVHDAFQTTGRR
jgi:aspartyl-tRNA(Asn)/glutamyl-tRNA(Gln) amidotransferase subunit A